MTRQVRCFQITALRPSRDGSSRLRRCSPTCESRHSQKTAARKSAMGVFRDVLGSKRLPSPPAQRAGGTGEHRVGRGNIGGRATKMAEAQATSRRNIRPGGSTTLGICFLCEPRVTPRHERIILLGSDVTPSHLTTPDILSHHRKSRHCTSTEFSRQRLSSHHNASLTLQPITMAQRACELCLTCRAFVQVGLLLLGPR